MLPIRVTPSASLQIQEAADWWVANRSSAPRSFRDDLRQAFDLISYQPGIGATAANIVLQGVQRVYLERLRYFLYYRVRPDRVEILALWHSNRGEAPQLWHWQLVRQAYLNAGITSLANSRMDLVTFSWGMPPKEKLQPK